MHGVEMSQHQNARAVALAPPRRGLAFEDIAEAVDPRRALEPQPKVAELTLDLVDNDIHRLGVVAGTFDRHPFDDAVENLLGIDFRFVLLRIGSHQTGSHVKYSGERLRSVK